LVLPALNACPSRRWCSSLPKITRLGVKDVPRKAGLGGGASMNCQKVRELLPLARRLGQAGLPPELTRLLAQNYHRMVNTANCPGIRLLRMTSALGHGPAPHLRSHPQRDTEGRGN